MIRTHKGDIILFCNAWGRSETGEEIEYTYGTIYSINSDNGAINWKTKVNPYLLIDLQKVIDTGTGLLFESDITYECVWQPGGEGYDCMVPSYVFLDYNGNVKWVSKEESLTLQQKSIVDDTLFNDKYGKSLKDKLEEMYYFYKKTDTISIVKQINAEDERVYTLVNITLDSKPFPVFIIQNKEDDQIIIKQIDSSKITYATDFELFEDTICIVGKQYKAISNASKTNYHFSTMILNRSNGEELHTYTEKEEIDDFHAWIKNVNNAKVVFSQAKNRYSDSTEISLINSNGSAIKLRYFSRYGDTLYLLDDDLTYLTYQKDGYIYLSKKTIEINTEGFHPPIFNSIVSILKHLSFDKSCVVILAK